MKVLSLFDGMACGALAMQAAGIEIEKYVAYEVDKYAIQTAQHNFPFIEERGDVFKADFTEYVGFDYLIGGSPCTYWSIAQTKNRETVASGMGWELFSQYVRALHEAKPRFFLYENNKSMSAAIRASITETFGFEPILINSALVSAQNRQRLYWCGIRQADGTYKKADIQQPADRGILLKDILETNGTTWLEKHVKSCVAVAVNPLDKGNEARPLTASYFKYAATDSFKKANPRMGVAEQLNVDEIEFVNYNLRKDSEIVITDRNMRCAKNDLKHSSATESVVMLPNAKSNALITAHGVKVFEKIADPVCVAQRGRYDESGKGGQGNRVYSIDGKAVAQTAPIYVEKNKVVSKAIEDIVNQKGYFPEMFNPYNRAEITNKSPTVTASCDHLTTSSAVLIVEPTACRLRGRTDKNGSGYGKYECRNDRKANALDTNVTNGAMVAEPVCVAQRGRYDESGKVYQHFEAQPTGKTNNLTTVSKDNLIAEPICVNSKSGRAGVEGLQPSLQDRVYDTAGKMPAVTSSFNPKIAEPVNVMKYELQSVENKDAGVVGILDMAGQEQIKRVYGTNGKCATLTTCQGGHREPKVFERIADPVCVAQRGRYDAPIYEVKDGFITVKGNKYPIKLVDGFYIIRKLTVRECMRLQTVPEWYEWPVSKSQAYKMLGNGWTVEVIAHLLRGLK